MFFNLLRDWPISKPKKISKNGKVLRLLKRNSMESSGKFEITKKNTPKFDVKNSPLKKPDKKVSTSPFNLMVSLRNQTPLLRRGVMVSCEAPQRSRRWSLKFLELIGGSSKCPQSNAGLPKVDMNESKVGSPGVTKLTKNKSPLAEIVWFWVVRASILHLSHCTFWVIFQNIAMFPAPRCGVW